MGRNAFWKKGTITKNVTGFFFGLVLQWNPSVQFIYVCLCLIEVWYFIIKPLLNRSHLNWCFFLFDTIFTLDDNFVVETCMTNIGLVWYSQCFYKIRVIYLSNIYFIQKKNASLLSWYINFSTSSLVFQISGSH